MALKIFWTKRASKSFDDILAYLEEEFGEAATKAFAIKVHSFVDILQDFPELGVMQDQQKKIRGFAVVKQCTIYYRVHQDYIKILYLFDNRQKPQKK